MRCWWPWWVIFFFFCICFLFYFVLFFFCFCFCFCFCFSLFLSFLNSFFLDILQGRSGYLWCAIPRRGHCQPVGQPPKHGTRHGPRSGLLLLLFLLLFMFLFLFLFLFMFLVVIFGCSPACVCTARAAGGKKKERFTELWHAFTFPFIQRARKESHIWTSSPVLEIATNSHRPQTELSGHVSQTKCCCF